jgi:hypothetical protein
MLIYVGLPNEAPWHGIYLYRGCLLVDSRARFNCLYVSIFCTRLIMYLEDENATRHSLCHKPEDQAYSIVQRRETNV